MMLSGGERLICNVFPPCYAAPREDVDKAEVMLLLKEPNVRVLFLQGGHFSPMLMQAQREAGVFPPRDLLLRAPPRAA